MNINDPRVLRTKQHFIDYNGLTKEQFINYFDISPADEKDNIIDNVLIAANPEWLKARRGHITASNAKKFLSFAPNKKDISLGFYDVVRDYIAEIDGQTLSGDDIASTWTEKAAVKQGLIFESRAIDLFKQITGIKLKSDIGFISNNIDGINIGVSTDAYAVDEKDNISIIAEIKSFTRSRQIKERENAIKESAVSDQMQWGMLASEAKIAYKILYNRYNDTIQYIKWTRGLNFIHSIKTRIPIALDYIAKVRKEDRITDLTEIFE